MTVVGSYLHVKEDPYASDDSSSSEESDLLLPLSSNLPLDMPYDPGSDLTHDTSALVVSDNDPEKKHGSLESASLPIVDKITHPRRSGRSGRQPTYLNDFVCKKK